MFWWEHDPFTNGALSSKLGVKDYKWLQYLETTRSHPFGDKSRYIWKIQKNPSDFKVWTQGTWSGELAPHHPILVYGQELKQLGLYVGE